MECFLASLSCLVKTFFGEGLLAIGAKVTEYKMSQLQVINVAVKGSFVNLI
ncbi:hypothetical protein THIOSC15_2570008 [uncultured Thiomicrorhabdus sp.]|jgi:hypothetical protein